MISREDFVGTVMTFREGDDVLITDFLGEGSEKVAFGIAPLSDPSRTGRVVVFIKPRPFFEMTVLHHYFRVCEELYPDHTMLMSPQERMVRLLNEMIERVHSPRFEFRVAVYREIMASAIRGMTKAIIDRKASIDCILTQPGMRPRLDENICYRIEELLEEDEVSAEQFDALTILSREIPRLVAMWKGEGTYAPFSSNILYNSLGLFLEHFVNLNELDSIMRDSRVAENVTVRTLGDLLWLAPIFHTRAEGSVRRLEKCGASDRWLLTGEIEASIRNAVMVCRLVREFVSQERWSNSELLRLACHWHERVLALKSTVPDTP